MVEDIDIEALRLDIYLKIVSFTLPQTDRMSQQKLSFSYNSHTCFSTRSKFHGQVAWFDRDCKGFDGLGYLIELETKVHPKVRNHGEGPY